MAETSPAHGHPDWRRCLETDRSLPPERQRIKLASESEGSFLHRYTESDHLLRSRLRGAVTHILGIVVAVRRDDRPEAVSLQKPAERRPGRRRARRSNRRSTPPSAGPRSPKSHTLDEEGTTRAPRQRANCSFAPHATNSRGSASGGRAQSPTRGSIAQTSRIAAIADTEPSRPRTKSCMHGHKEWSGRGMGHDTWRPIIVLCTHIHVFGNSVRFHNL